MKIKTADFVISSPSLKLCPFSHLPEYAFIGRSNVGKSTLINYIANHKKLAKTSKTPGKTKLINYFIFNEKWHLVDLPGYGYAKVSKKSRRHWASFIEDYLSNRENLKSVFILIDGNISPQRIDLDFVKWCGDNNIPFSIVFTKIDKSKLGVRQKNIALFKKVLKIQYGFDPNYFQTSSEKKQGAGEILEYIDFLNKN